MVVAGTERSTGGREDAETKRRNRRTLLSPLQMKGFCLLAFVALTESVTLTKAVQFVATVEGVGARQGGGYQQFSQGGQKHQPQQQEDPSSTSNQECSLSSSSDETCTSSYTAQQQPQQPSILKRTLGPLGRIKNRFSKGKNTHQNRRGQQQPKFSGSHNNYYYYNNDDDNGRDCCAEFEACVVHNPEILRQCALMRGGALAGVAAEAATGAAGAVSMPYGIPLNGWKVIFQAFLTALNVVCWLVPLRSKKISENKLALSIANAFSGGVFLSLAFGHLIPECVHGFEGLTNNVTPYLLVLSGYLLIFFVEKVAFDAHEILHEMEHAQDHKVISDVSTTSNGSAPAAVPADSTMSTSSTTSSNGDSAAVEGATSGRSALILLGALAVHSILEMAALGLADTFSDSAILTLSIALHQPAESIALLVAFLKSGMPKGQIIRFLSVFSAMGPIGVALGMAVNEFAAPIVDSIMVAVVAGTFVYVGATEVIPEEWEDGEHKWLKFGALMTGVISILIITQYTMTLG